MNFVLQWMDVIWLVLAFVVAHKPQRLLAVGLVAGCMLMMRLQVELMESIGHPHGLLPLMNSHVFFRGMLVYSVFYMLYLVFAHYSPRSKGSIFTAASITVFFIALFVSTIVMVL